MSELDNQAPVTPENPAPTGQVPGPEATGGPGTEPMQPSMTWKEHLSADNRGSALLEKFENTRDGLNKAFESHNNLESLLGHEKVPIPKGPDDTEGWNRYNKAMGIPDAAEGYGLESMAMPEGFETTGLEKDKFAEIAHAHKLTPDQAKGIWEAYQSMTANEVNSMREEHQAGMDKAVNDLRGEWGDSFDTRVELGQAVINKFSADQDMQDFITDTMSSDPRGAKFLARIGEQFAENKVPEFQMKRFSQAPHEAQEQIDKMTRDLDGPYMNVGGKHSPAEHQAAMDQVNAMRLMINKTKG